MKPYTLLYFLLLLFCSFSGFSQIHVNEDFNGGALPANWSNSAITGTHAWSFGIDGSSDHSGSQNLDGTNFAYFDDSFYGVSSNSDHTYLETPSFDNSSASVTFLEFDYNFRNFGAAVLDSFDVQVYDGTNWISVFSRTSDDCGNYISGSCFSGFPHAKIDISSYKNTNCKVRFIYFDGNDWSWYVGLDNVSIYSPSPNDIGVSIIETPFSSCGLSTSEIVQLKIKNYGTVSQSNFTVSYTVNNGIQITEQVNQTLGVNDSLIFAFNTRTNMSTTGMYDIKAFTALNNDAFFSNDTARKSVQNFSSFSPSYSESFESGLGGWITYGQNSSWQDGIPNGTLINSSTNGSKIVGTNLSGNYNNLELSYLESPCFDFTGGLSDPILAFSLSYNTETLFDMLWMEYSLDNGNSWLKLNSAQNSYNWYNDTTLNVWSGNSNGWVDVENILKGLNNQSQIRLRFAFQTDGSQTLEGIGVDSFSIRFPELTDLAVNQIVYPNFFDSAGCGLGIETVIVNVHNRGISPLNNYPISYQVNNGAIHTDIISSSIAPNAIQQLTFSMPYNFGNISSFDFKVWSGVAGDTYTSNDTIQLDSILNRSSTVNTLPYVNTFDNFNLGVPGSFGTVNGGWTRETTSANSFNEHWWAVGEGLNNHSVLTGPSGDKNTGGNGGYYMYTEASSGRAGDMAYLISPCINLSNDSSITLSFWWHRYGSSIASPLYVDVFDGFNWINVNSVSSQPQMSNNDPWVNKLVDLSPFKGRTVKVRFWAVSGGCCSGDMAIDDVRVFGNSNFPELVDLSIVGGQQDICTNDVNINYPIAIKNLGDSAIFSDTLFVGIQNLNGQIRRDTQFISIAKNDSILYYFSDILSGNSDSWKIWIEFENDLIALNDSIQLTFSNTVIRLPYYQNFDNVFNEFGMCINQYDWQTDQLVTNNPYDWRLREGPTFYTSPTYDHTNNSVNGSYWFCNQVSFLHTLGFYYFTPQTELPFIDLSQESNAALNFWHHLRLDSGSVFYVDVYPKYDSAFYIRDSITSQFVNNDSANWSSYFYDLSPFVGDTIKIRFHGKMYNFWTRMHFAIDDISITSLPVGVNEAIQLDKSFSVFPNPSDGQFNLVLSDKSLIGEWLQIFNTKGQLVKEQNIVGLQNQIDLEGYPKGMYYMMVTSSNSRISKKLVIH